MNWSNVNLILRREIRDQLRDRRTLFMIAVLPLLLYPLLGMSFFQISQFMHEQTTRVLVVGAPEFGAPEFDGLPPLLDGDHFTADLFSVPERTRLLEVTRADNANAASGAVADDPLQQFRREVQQGKYEVLVYFPKEFAGKLRQFHEDLLQDRSAEDDSEHIPSPIVYHNTANEKSQIANLRVTEVLNRWIEAIGRKNLTDSKVSALAAKPFSLASDDVAEQGNREAVVWSKVLPFVLLLWALTGAFYPAVDLCAGEKERGTLETLLSSPAERSEIVWGKLLTVMIFSMATAVLNLVSMGITGSFVLSQMPNFGPPPLLSIVWLLLALVPVSALFSALCLALAAFARSTKEGQYYLMPLVLITMPLTILPMAPGVELNLGNSLIPITGIVLLLRTLLEGNYMAALPYVPVVTGVALLCCLLAVRWAADQFNTESVLFRESERWDFSLWIKHLMRDREDTPSVSEGIFCGVLILLIQFFMSFALGSKGHNLATLAMVSQLVIILTPAMLMTIMLTRNPAKTLLLRVPPLLSVPAALGLAVALHPVKSVLSILVQKAYPIDERIARELNQLFGEINNVWLLLLIAGVAPAICEELAFRGFILSGLRHMGNKWRAIVVSSIFFGVTHVIFQQSLVACLLGAVIGYIAVQTGSIWPGMVFHLVSNTLAVLSVKITSELVREYPDLGWLVARVNPETLEQHPALRLLLVRSGDELIYHWPVVALGGLAALAILVWFRNLPYARSAEESLQEAIDHQAVGVANAG